MKLNKTAMRMLFLVTTNYEFTIAMIKMLESSNRFVDKDKLFSYLVNECNIDMSEDKSVNYLSCEELNVLTKCVYDFILKDLKESKTVVLSKTLINKEEAEEKITKIFNSIDIVRIVKEEISNKELIELIYTNKSHIIRDFKYDYMSFIKSYIGLVNIHYELDNFTYIDEDLKFNKKDDFWQDIEYELRK